MFLRKKIFQLGTNWPKIFINFTLSFSKSLSQFFWIGLYWRTLGNIVFLSETHSKFEKNKDNIRRDAERDNTKRESDTEQDNTKRDEASSDDEQDASSDDEQYNTNQDNEDKPIQLYSHRFNIDPIYISLQILQELQQINEYLKKERERRRLERWCWYSLLRTDA